MKQQQNNMKNKTWKIKNVHNASIKLIIGTAQVNSLGLMLEPGMSVICSPKQTPVMDAQTRRKLIDVDRNFDNTLYNLELGVKYNDEQIEEAKLKTAEIK